MVLRIMEPIDGTGTLKNCNKCNKELPKGHRFLTCKDCYIKENKNKERKEIAFDLNKNYKVNGWILLGTFTIGFLLGAMIF